MGESQKEKKIMLGLRPNFWRKHESKRCTCIQVFTSFSLPFCPPDFFFLLFICGSICILHNIISLFSQILYTQEVSCINSASISLLLCVVGAAQSGVRRNLETRRAAGAVRRRRCFMKWPVSCLSHTASAHIWIKPPS